MVKDPKFYDILQVSPTANDLELKKAYRRAAIQLHPDKNLNDPNAHKRFQELGEAYQVLSNEKLRKQYDKLGPEVAKGNVDADSDDDFLSMAFGGEAFEDWIGEFSLIKNLLEKMEILVDPDEEENELDPDKAESDKNQSNETSSKPNGVSDIGEPSSTKPAQPMYKSSPDNIPHRLAIKGKSEEELKAESTSMTKEEKDKVAREKRDARMKALAALNEEQKKRRQERISTLTQKLVDRVSIWTETDKGSDVTESFKNKIQLEIEGLKMESFGVEMLHSMGLIYSQKASSFLKSQKFYGLTGIFNRTKDKVNSIKDDLGTFALARDTFKSFRELGIEREKMLEAQEAKGSEFTLEERVEFEHKAGGTVLGAALRANTYEIRDILRDVCDRMLYDKNVKLEKRIERATALSMIGDLCQKAKRSEKEQQEYQAFEQLVREAAQKKRETNKANNGHKTNSEPPETSSEYKPKTSESDERGTHT